MTEKRNDLHTDVVFVYETLRDPRIRYKALHHLKDASPGSIVGYREVSVNTKEGANYHTIIPFVKSAVAGNFFEVSNEELRDLDGWESQYHRHKVLVYPTDQNGGPLKAWTYVLKPEAIRRVF